MAAAGIYGKHPGFGDFISAGLPVVAERHLLPWLTSLLAETRDGLAGEWEPVWDAALPIRFWIGGGIWGGPHLQGVARPSRDRVGRRFPLIAVAETMAAPPMVEPDQGFYLAAEAELAADLTTPADLCDRLARVVDGGEIADAASPTFWAANPALDVVDLLAQLDATDRLRAVAARSYWWQAAGEGRASAVLASDGLPRAGELAWLLAGVPAPPPEIMPRREDRNAGRQ